MNQVKEQKHSHDIAPGKSFLAETISTHEERQREKLRTIESENIPHA